MNIIHIVSSKPKPNKTSDLEVPCDIHTIPKKLQIECVFEQHVCCPHCYSLYEVEVAPEECTYKPTIASNKCYAYIFDPSKIWSLPHIRFTTSNPNPSSKRPPRQAGQIQLHGQPRLCNPK
ncbi:hypothetical protein O181_118880 [Austropuccinia psidii MF-1]|uniref:Uncharacterized protein n=1 Tax=Austropuccinia psidii MF-1 TaxID=1389203 RepID=A0A9Q3KD06_9BASI|nr:hypothetical protein [Austropuccinia psidii MF-1]